MAGEGLHCFANTNVPQFGKHVACARDKDVVGSRVDADAHDISQMVCKLGDLGSRLNVPEYAGHVTGRRQDTSVVDEAAAGQVSRMAREFTGDSRRPISGGQVVDGADVVEATAGDVVAGWSVGAGHDPGGTQGDGVDLVGGVGVPDDELAIL